MRLRLWRTRERPRERRPLRGAYGAAFLNTDDDGAEYVRRVVRVFLACTAPAVELVNPLPEDE